MEENIFDEFVLACVVKNKKDTGISGMISKELLDELYELFDRIFLWQKEHSTN